MFVNEMAIRVASEALLVHCGYGFCDDYPISRISRGVRYGTLGGGATEALKDLVGKKLVEVSMQDATYCSLASNPGMLHARGAEAPARTGNRHGGLGISPYNAYPITHGYVVLNAPGDHHFRSILEVMGRSDLKQDPRFLTRSARVANFSAMDELIESWTRTLTRNEVAHGCWPRKCPARRCVTLRRWSRRRDPKMVFQKGKRNGTA